MIIEIFRHGYESLGGVRQDQEVGVEKTSLEAQEEGVTETGKVINTLKNEEE